MKKIIPLLLTISTYLFVSSQAFATNNVVNVCPSGPFSKLCNITVGSFIGGIISFMFIISALLALFYLVWGGIKWLTSGGDKTNVETARGHIIAAVVGLIIIFISYVILNLVWSFFFGTSLTTLTIPTLP